MANPGCGKNRFMLKRINDRFYQHKTDKRVGVIISGGLNFMPRVRHLI